MATLTLHQLGDHIAGLTLRDAAELSRYLQEVHGLAPAAPAKEVVRDDTPPVHAVPTSFNVSLTSAGATKVAVIRAVSKMLGIGLLQAREFIDRVPTLLAENVDAQRVAAIQQQIEEAGGTVSVE
jgi:large subunit ribosomal protein L7/L12